MLRRTSAGLFRRTPARLSGGSLYVPPKLDAIPPSSGTTGFFGAYNDGSAIFRFFDIKWMMTRCVELGREHYIATPCLFAFLWFYCWKGFQTLVYKDGKPPRTVDWNTEETGKLPHNFQPTVVTKRV